MTGAKILTHVGEGSPAADQTAWANSCAAALEAVIAHRLTGVTITAGIEAELNVAAVQDGAACYAARKAPHGVLSVGPDGDVVRLGREITRELEPVFLRYAGPGIG